MQFFWVNQSKFKKEKELGVIRADTRDSKHHARVRILDVRKGDVIFSFSKNGFQAVLVAEENAASNKKNCTVNCTYILLDSNIELSTVINFVEKHLPELYSPINSKGKRAQGYLYPINEKVASILLELCKLEIEIPEVEIENKPSNPPRKDICVSRIIRNTKKSQNVKNMYKNSCQVCGIKLITVSGNYSEGAHIIPLGKPHNGSDDESNILCLCPNHHVLLDGFSFSISENGDLIGIEGKLKINNQHKIAKESLAWHKMMYNK